MFLPKFLLSGSSIECRWGNSCAFSGLLLLVACSGPHDAYSVEGEVWEGQSEVAASLDEALSNGTVVDESKNGGAPYSSTVQMGPGSGVAGTCGAVKLWEGLYLTAAHCAASWNLTPDVSTVRFSNDVDGLNASSSVHTATVRGVYLHPTWSPGNTDGRLAAEGRAQNTALVHVDDDDAIPRLPSVMRRTVPDQGAELLAVAYTDKKRESTPTVISRNEFDQVSSAPADALYAQSVITSPHLSHSGSLGAPLFWKSGRRWVLAGNASHGQSGFTLFARHANTYHWIRHILISLAAGEEPDVYPDVGPGVDGVLLNKGVLGCLSGDPNTYCANVDGRLEWRLEHAEHNTDDLRIIDQKTGKCLEVQPGAVGLTDCTDGVEDTAATWHFAEQADGSYEIRSRANNWCLSMNGNATFTWLCAATEPKQAWILHR